MPFRGHISSIIFIARFYNVTKKSWRSYISGIEDIKEIFQRKETGLNAMPIKVILLPAFLENQKILLFPLFASGQNWFFILWLVFSKGRDKNEKKQEQTNFFKCRSFRKHFRFKRKSLGISVICFRAGNGTTSEGQAGFWQFCQISIYKSKWEKCCPLIAEELLLGHSPNGA